MYISVCRFIATAACRRASSTERRPHTHHVSAAFDARICICAADGICFGGKFIPASAYSDKIQVTHVSVLLSVRVYASIDGNCMFLYPQQVYALFIARVCVYWRAVVCLIYISEWCVIS